MQLENMMEMYQPRVSEQRQQTYFVVGDLESLSASALYGKGNSGGNFKWSKDGLFIPIKCLDVPLHDTYNKDSDGNLSNGHSTINLPRGGKVYMPFGTGKPSIKSGS
jgi:hypothetical protein